MTNDIRVEGMDLQEKEMRKNSTKPAIPVSGKIYMVLRPVLKVTSLDGLLQALGSRSILWPRDKAIITRLLTNISIIGLDTV